MQKGPPYLPAGSDLAGKEERLLCRVDRDQLTVGPSLEGHYTVSCGEESIVTSTPDVPTGVKLRAALPYDDAAGWYLLPTETLHAKELRVAVTTISAGAYTLFMCHRCPQINRPA